MAEHKPIDPTKPRIMCGEYDVTDHVATMYDCLVQSMDWGSGFLSADEQQSILIVGILAGWDYCNPDKGSEICGIKPPNWPDRASQDYDTWINGSYKQYLQKMEEWKAQVKAAIEAKAPDCFNEDMCERVGTHLLSKVTTPNK